MTKISLALGSYNLVRKIHIWHWYNTECNKCWLKEGPLISSGELRRMSWKQHLSHNRREGSPPPSKGNKAEGKNWTEMCMRKAQAHNVHHVECVSKVPNGFCDQKNCMRGEYRRQQSWGSRSRSWSTLIDTVRSQNFILWTKEHGRVC